MKIPSHKESVSGFGSDDSTGYESEFRINNTLINILLLSPIQTLFYFLCSSSPVEGLKFL